MLASTAYFTKSDFQFLRTYRIIFFKDMLKPGSVALQQLRQNAKRRLLRKVTFMETLISIYINKLVNYKFKQYLLLLL